MLERRLRESGLRDITQQPMRGPAGQVYSLSASVTDSANSPALPPPKLVMQDRLVKVKDQTSAESAGPLRRSAGRSFRASDVSKAPRQEVEEEEYDEDGLRVVWSSGPKAEVLEARSAWRALSLAGCVSWSQTSDEINAWIKIPKGNTCDWLTAY